MRRVEQSSHFSASFWDEDRPLSTLNRPTTTIDDTLLSQSTCHPQFDFCSNGIRGLSKTTVWGPFNQMAVQVVLRCDARDGLTRQPTDRPPTKLAHDTWLCCNHAARRRGKTVDLPECADLESVTKKTKGNLRATLQSGKLFWPVRTP